MVTLLDMIRFRPLRWMMTFAWTVFVSIILIQPEQNPVISTGIPPGPITLEREILFTTLHLIAFGTTCGLWFWAWFGHVSLSQSLLLAVVIAIIIGAVTEYMQSFAPDRYPSWIDFFTNCTGALLIAQYIWRKQKTITIINKM